MSTECSFPGCGRPVFVKRTSHGPLCNGHYAQMRRKQPLKPLRDYKRQDQSSNQYDICPFPGCGRPSWHKHGYCQTHQRQLWAADGDTSQLKPIRRHESQIDKQCKYPGCDKPAKSRGYCSKHYRQDWGECKISDCKRRIHNKKTGYCAKHYQHFRRLRVKQEVQS